MATTIEVRRGLKANLPLLAAAGEFLWCTDTSELFIGTGAGVAIPATNAVLIQNIAVLGTMPGDGQILIFDAVTGKYIPGDPIVSGSAADGAVPSRNPVRVGGTGTDGLVHSLLTDSLGDLNVIALENQGIGVLLQNILLEMRATKAAILALDQTLNPQDFTAEQFQDQFIN